MAAFAPGQTHVTRDPFIQVDGLPAGVYRFRLEAVDQAGNVSAPAELTVTVVAPAPTPTPTPTPTLADRIRITQPIERVIRQPFIRP